MAWSCFVDKFHLFYLFVPNKGCNDACLNVLRVGIMSNHLLCMMLMISLMCFTVESIWFIAYISLHYHCLLFLCLIYFVPNFLTSLLSNTQGRKDIYRNKRRLTLEVLLVMMKRGMTPKAFVKIEIFLKYHSYVIIFVKKN